MRILVFGTFDGLHPGHRFVIDEAMKRGDLTIVVARDATVSHIKNKTPMHSEDERMKAIQEAYPSATVMLGDPKDYMAPVRAVQPDLILFGYDQKLPPRVTDADMPCAVERLPAFKPEQYKSSLLRGGSEA